MSEHYCELHDWQTIGTVTTDTAALVITDPGASATLARAWYERLKRMSDPDREPLGNFEELKLDGEPERTHPWVEARGTEHALAIRTDSDGSYDVDARFCDLYGDGHLSICEVRLRLHYHDDEED
jgi:hypothetical protein